MSLDIHLESFMSSTWQKTKFFFSPRETESDMLLSPGALSTAILLLGQVKGRIEMEVEVG